jgi:hypothetical protein
MRDRSNRILFFCNGAEDYLADGLLHGLKKLLGHSVIDLPRCDILYSDCPPQVRASVRGNGFTLYGGLLPPDSADRSRWIERIASRRYRLIVFSDIWNQWGLMAQSLPHLDFENTAILDTADAAQPYPYAGYWWRRPALWFAPKAHTRFRYFKREITSETSRYFRYLLISNRLAAKLPLPRNLRKTSFSIPGELILSEPPRKLKEFATHVVDAELAAAIPGACTSYAFPTQEQYYRDLQISRFGITTKRAGWDCLRHYEIAANGCVPCFRSLGTKPLLCAPHGLNEDNCVSYRSAEDLLAKIRLLTPERYEALQRGALAWARANTTEARAREFLAEFNWKV